MTGPEGMSRVQLSRPITRASLQPDEGALLPTRTRLLTALTVTLLAALWLSGGAVAAVPDAPTNVSAVAGNAQATVSFFAPDSNGGSAITSYTVTSAPGGVTASASGSSILVTGLTNGTAYTFTVTAKNSDGVGAASAASNQVTPVAAPGTPESVGATAGDGQASVSFSTPSSNGSPITSYTVTSLPDGITATGASSPVTVTGLADGRTYRFYVTATNAVGTGLSSTLSNPVIPGTTPGAPTGVSAVAGAAQATVSFTAPDDGGLGIGGYTVVSSPGGITASGSSSPVTVTGLTPGTAYTFTVSAQNSAGSGPPSATSNAVVPLGAGSSQVLTPGSPTTLTISAGGKTVVAHIPALSVPATARLTAVTSISSSSGYALAADSIGVKLDVTSATGTAITSFPKPVDLGFANAPTDDSPSYSHDGVTWTPIPSIAGPTLPSGYPDGWYVDSTGAVHVLTMHATSFALLTAVGGPPRPSLQLRYLIPGHFVLDKTGMVRILVAPTLTAKVTITLTQASKTVAVWHRTLSKGQHVVTLNVPKNARHSGTYRLEVNAVSGDLETSKQLTVQFATKA